MVYGLLHLKKYGEDISYVLGVIMGDGCIYKQIIKGNLQWLPILIRNEPRETWAISLEAKDKEFVEEFMIRLVRCFKRPDWRKPRSVHRTPRGYWQVVVRSRGFGEWYKTGVWTKIVTEYPRGFLRGLYDSDGNLSKPKKTYVIRIFKGNKELLEFAVKLIESLGINCSLRIFRKAGQKTNMTESCQDLWVIAIYGSQAIKFYKEMGSSISRKRIKEVELNDT